MRIVSILTFATLLMVVQAFGQKSKSEVAKKINKTEKPINDFLFEVNQLLILFYSSSFFGKNRSISDDTFSRISSTILAYSNFGFPET